jgi:hypothetical protein
MMIVSPDDRIGSALSGIGARLEGTAACTLGLMLALCLAGLAGLLAFDAVVAALGFVAGGGLIRSRAVVRDALERAGWSDPRMSDAAWGRQHYISARTPKFPDGPACSEGVSGRRRCAVRR